MKNGFTLVELLGVIILLAVLSGLVIFSVGGSIKKSKNKISDIQKKNIIQAAKTYYLKEGMNEENINDKESETCVSITYLLDNGYIDYDEIKGLSNEEYGLSSVKITYTGNKYIYEYKDQPCNMEN